MQADEFEKKIQAKMEEFELVPDSEVWKQVATRIEKEKKKRRVVFYWLFTGFALLAVTLFYWFNNNENNRKLAINKVNHDTSKSENYKIKQSVPNSLKKLNKVQKADIKKDIAHLKKGRLKPVLKTQNTVQSKIIFTKVINRKPILLPQKKYNNIYKENKKYAQKTLPSHRFYNPELAKGTASLKNTSANKKLDFKKDTLTNRAAKKTIQTKRQTNKKLNFGFTVYSGISDNLSGLPLMEKSYMLDSYSSPNAMQSGNYYYSTINISNNFKSAFSFGLGVFVKRQLTERISLSGGVDFHIYRAESVVGIKVNQTSSFYDSSFQNATSVNRYYTTGTSVKYTNKYQLLEAPINILFQLNKNQKRSLLISAGIVPGYLLGSNALYANPSANVYYVDKEKFHHVQLSGQMALSFPLKSSSGYLLNAGPAVQYAFTNATKAAGVNQHLFFTGLKANIILK